MNIVKLCHTTTISTAVPLLLLKPTCIERDAPNPVLRSSNAETVIKISEQAQLYFRRPISHVRHVHGVKLNVF